MFMPTNSKKTADARDAHDAHGPKIQQEWNPTPQAIILEYIGDCLIGTPWNIPTFHFWHLRCHQNLSPKINQRCQDHGRSMQEGMMSKGQGHYWAYHECCTMPRGYGSTYVCIRSYVPFWGPSLPRVVTRMSLKCPNPKKRIISWVLNLRWLYHIESCSVWICFSVNICQTLPNYICKLQLP